MPKLPVYEDGDTDGSTGASGLQNILAIDRTGAVLMLVGILLFFRRRSALRRMHGPGTNHLGIQR